MSEQTVAPVLERSIENELVARFPEYVSLETRKGYEGVLVKPEKLVEVATAVRDELGYDYLSSVTGVDYLPEGMMETVYHFFKTTGGPKFVMKAQFPRDQGGRSFSGPGISRRRFTGTRSLGFVGHPFRRPSGSAPDPALGRF